MSDRVRSVGQWVLWYGLALVSFALAGGKTQPGEPEPGPDRGKAYRSNNRGIALMEQYHFGDAVEAFEETVRLAPDWLPGQINLGIALLNNSSDDAASIKRTEKIFREVLRREPDNPHAHFGLGILLRYQKDEEEAVKHFEAVLQKDPNDTHSWYWLGTLQKPGSEEQSKCYREARIRDRHLGGPLYGLAMNLRRKDHKRTEALLKELEALAEVDWQNIASSRYGEWGPYAEVISQVTDPRDRPRIGPLPRFRPRSLKVRLAADTRWASAADFGPDAVGEVRRRVRARFGATLVALDYNGDGKLDLFLAGAAVEKGQLRDLLLRNDGAGRFTDVTAEAGLAGPRPTLGCVVADFDNDEKPDLLLTGVGVQRLFRNTGGKFEDVTARAGLDKLTSVCLGASFVDLDHDGALDVLICEYAASARQAVGALKGERKPGGWAVFRNVGTAPRVGEHAKRPALTCAFRRERDVPGLKDETLGLTNLAVADLDGDGDLDWIVLADHACPTPILNDRLLRFHRQTRPASTVLAGVWNGALVLDADHDGRSDLLLVGPGQAPRLLSDRVPLADEEGGQWFKAGTIAAPGLRQAVAADLDLDGWTDVVGLSKWRPPVLLHNKGGRLEVEADALGADFPRDLIALTVCDIDGDDRPDVIIWSESQGLQLRENPRNDNSALHLELACTKQRDRGSVVRCSADGFGTRVMVHAGAVYAGQEWTTLSAGLGQSRQPLLLGLGASPRADAVRLRWPDGVRQAERDLPAGRRTRLEWKQRKSVW